MARLTAAIRDAIIANVIEHKDFRGKEMAIVQKRADFIERLRQYALEQYGLTDERLTEIKAQIESFNKEVTYDNKRFVCVDFSGSESTWDVNLSGQARRLYRNGRLGHRSELFEESKASVDNTKFHPHYRENDFIVRDPSWREELDAINLEHQKMREEYENVKSTMMATLSNFTTIEKLLEAWPDAKELIPDNLPLAKKPGTNVALSVADLNALCGLPSGE